MNSFFVYSTENLFITVRRFFPLRSNEVAPNAPSRIYAELVKAQECRTESYCPIFLTNLFNRTHLLAILIFLIRPENLNNATLKAAYG
jgi:hypothetical protein